jgi:putative transposase
MVKVKTQVQAQIKTVNLFPHTRYEKSLILHQIPLEIGQRITKLDTLGLEMVRVRDFTMLKMLRRSLEEQNPLILRVKYVVMQEFLQIIRKKTLIDKLNFLRTRIRKQKSFLTLVRDSILKERVFKPFWKECTLGISKQLWLPTKIDCVDLVSRSLNGYLKNQTQNSWFSTNFQVMKNQEQLNLQKISYPLQQCLLQETMVTDQLTLEDKENLNSVQVQKIKRRKRKKRKKKAKEKAKPNNSDELAGIENNGNNKNQKNKFTAVKFRIYPTDEQKITFNQMIGSTRFIYNQCLGYIKNEYKTNGTTSGLITSKNLREKIINNKNYEDVNKWMLGIPYDVRDEAMRDLLKNYKSNFAKKNKNITFDIKFKSKKDSTESMNILSKHWGTKGMYGSVFNSNLKCEKQLPEVLEHTCRLVKTKLNHYYICIPKMINKINNTNKNSFEKDNVSVCDSQANNTIIDIQKLGKVASIDPGVRTFATCYDPSGLMIKFGDFDIGLLARLLHYKGKLQSQITHIDNHRERYHTKKALLRIFLRIKNLVDDCHKKVATFLCKNYNTIYIPKLDLHSMKNISKKVKSKLSVWRHCAFVDRLIQKSREFENCNVVVITEEYTSKTCGCCGSIKQNLYASKTFKCDVCGTVMDRDNNGSRNCFIKSLTEITIGELKLN